MESKQSTSKGALSTPFSIGFYLVWVAFWAVMLYYDYTHIAPYLYNASSFWFNAGYYGEPFSLVWGLALFASLFASAPLRQGKILAILGAVLLIATLTKPLVIHKVPQQDAVGFIKAHQAYMERLISQYTKPPKERSIDIDKAVRRLGFDDFYVKNGVYYFSSLAGVGESAGFLRAANGFSCPHRRCQKVAKNWYVYSTD